jgi:hypothetical protein
MKIEVFKLTKDFWYPSYNMTDQGMNKYLLVEVSILKTTKDGYRVMVNGCDDYYLVKYYERVSEAFKIFQTILEQEYVSIEFVKSLKFEML